MTAYTDTDVRNWYGDFADELTEDQVDAIAYAWGKISEITEAFYGEGPKEDLESLTEEPSIIAAQIIDGTTTIEEMVNRERRAALALSDARTATAAAMIAAEAAGMDIAEIARRAEMSRTTVYKRLDTLALED